MRAGLRIDVCTYRGTRLGVPALVALLEQHKIRASFFVSVGPDNMGRHLWRLRRPAFLRKMLRTGPARLYGWDVLLRGTLWPGPVIGRRLASIIRGAAERDHEIGLHAWDHHAWQQAADRMSASFVRAQLEQGVDLLGGVLGHAPTCSAAPGWRCNDAVLLERERFAFAYNSDCRGERAFRPVVAGRVLGQIQIPVTLPTYDEVIGRGGVTDRTYNRWLLDRMRDDGLNVLAIHAEVEGIVHLEMFHAFLVAARARGIEFAALGELAGNREAVRTGVIRERELPGREGRIACLA